MSNSYRRVFPGQRIGCLSDKEYEQLFNQVISQLMQSDTSTGTPMLFMPPLGLREILLDSYEKAIFNKGYPNCELIRKVISENTMVKKLFTPETIGLALRKAGIAEDKCLDDSDSSQQ